MRPHRQLKRHSGASRLGARQSFAESAYGHSFRVLLRRLGHDADAREAYRTALAFDPSPAEQRFILKRIGQLQR